MAWLTKARIRDFVVLATLFVVPFNCSYKKEDCRGSGGWGGVSEEAVAPSRDELRDMSCACAAPNDADIDCAEDLWDSREIADKAGCSQELDALLFCVEGGDGCDAETGEWACDADEIAWRNCIEAPKAIERATPSNRAIAPKRAVER